MALQYSFGQLLDKEWYAIGAIDDLFYGLGRQSLVACDPLHEHCALMPGQTAESEHRHVQPLGSGRLGSMVAGAGRG